MGVRWIVYRLKRCALAACESAGLPERWPRLCHALICPLLRSALSIVHSQRWRRTHACIAESNRCGAGGITISLTSATSPTR